MSLKVLNKSKAIFEVVIDSELKKKQKNLV